jgi:hypothetical protein
MMTTPEPLVVTISHSLGRDEAKRRIERGLGSIRGEIARHVTESITSGTATGSTSASWRCCRRSPDGSTCTMNPSGWSSAYRGSFTSSQRKSLAASSAVAPPCSSRRGRRDSSRLLGPGSANAPRPSRRAPENCLDLLLRQAVRRWRSCGGFPGGAMPVDRTFGDGS